MSDIDDFLQLQAQEGQFHSEGAFTIDLQAQLGRLKGHFLNSDTQAVLKLIQALVGWNALAIQIENCSQEFSIYASGIVKPNLVETIEANLNQASGLEDSPETDLLIGLSHLLQAKPDRVFFSDWNQSKVQDSRCWLGGQPKKLRRPPVGFTDGLGIHIQFEDALGAYEIDEIKLRYHTCYSPCLIYFRKALFGLNSLGKRGFIGEEFKSNSCLVEYFQVSSATNDLMWPRPQFNCANDQSPEIGWPNNTKNYRSELRQFSGAKQCIIHQQKSLDWLQSLVEWGKVALPSCSGSVFIWSLGKPGHIHIYLIKRGVYLESFLRPSENLSASVNIAVDNCRTDLSQFSTAVTKLEPDSNDPELKAIMERVNQLLSNAIDVCRAHPTVAVPAHLSLKEYVAVGAVSITSTLFLGPMAIIPAGIGSMVVATLVHQWQYGAKEKQQALDQIDKWQAELKTAEST